MDRAAPGALGRRAETGALRYLAARGLSLVDRNFRTRRGEIDLVMLDGHCLVFVEVRARGARRKVAARLTVDRHKQRKLASAALAFLARHPEYRHHPCRFDVVGVDAGAPADVQFDWLRDAFRPDEPGRSGLESAS